MIDLPPEYPTLCIISIDPAPGDPGFFELHMVSPWTDDGPMIVRESVIKYITEFPYQVVMCPPGYPDPPS